MASHGFGAGGGGELGREQFPFQPSNMEIATYIPSLKQLETPENQWLEDLISFHFGILAYFQVRTGSFCGSVKGLIDFRFASV